MLGKYRGVTGFEKLKKVITVVNITVKIRFVKHGQLIEGNSRNTLSGWINYRQCLVAHVLKGEFEKWSARNTSFGDPE